MSKNRFLNTEELYTPQYCSLYRAARWLAFEEKPVEECVAGIVYGYEHDDWDGFDEAIAAIHTKLVYGKLQAYGLSENLSSFNKISNEYFMDDACILWIDNEIRINKKTEYTDVSVFTEDLFKIFPANSNSKNLNASKNSYKPFYVQVIEEIINEFNISNDTQPPKQTILNWLQEKYPDLSNRDKESLATFVRLPEMKKGGYFKGKP